MWKVILIFILIAVIGLEELAKWVTMGLFTGIFLGMYIMHAFYAFRGSRHAKIVDETPRRWFAWITDQRRGGSNAGL